MEAHVSEIIFMVKNVFLITVHAKARHIVNYVVLITKQ